VTALVQQPYSWVVVKTGLLFSSIVCDLVLELFDNAEVRHLRSQVWNVQFWSVQGQLKDSDVYKWMCWVGLKVSYGDCRLNLRIVIASLLGYIIRLIHRRRTLLYHRVLLSTRIFTDFQLQSAIKRGHFP
jgi:hypothetical protein